MAEAQKKPSWLTKYWPIWLTIGLVSVRIALEVLRHYLPSFRGTSVVVTAQGDTLLYKSSLWIVALLLAPAVVLLVFALVLFRKPDWPTKVIGGALILFALLLAGMNVPMVFQGGLVLDRDGFTWTYGFWWQPVTKSVRFEQLDLMTLVRERDNMGEVHDLLECYTREGEVVSMPLGDDLHAALPAIRQRARRYNVVFEDLRNRGVPPRKDRGERPWLIVAAVALPLVIFGGLIALVFTWSRLHPANRMRRLLHAGDAAGAIRIGESVPLARREFSTRCNLVIAYQSAGRAREALALLSEIEAEGWSPKLATEEQYRIILEHLHKLVDLDSPPDTPEETPTS